jgi:hypothetical protein
MDISSFYSFPEMNIRFILEENKNERANEKVCDRYESGGECTSPS